MASTVCSSVCPSVILRFVSKQLVYTSSNFFTNFRIQNGIIKFRRCNPFSGALSILVHGGRKLEFVDQFHSSSRKHYTRWAHELIEICTEIGFWSHPHPYPHTSNHPHPLPQTFCSIPGHPLVCFHHHKLFLCYTL